MGVLITDAGYKEYQRLKREAKRREAEISERFRIKTQCSRCGFQSMDIYPEQNMMCPHWDCSGSMDGVD